jgi:hypothetical protein
MAKTSPFSKGGNNMMMMTKKKVNDGQWWNKIK